MTDMKNTKGNRCFNGSNRKPRCLAYSHSGNWASEDHSFLFLTIIMLPLFKIITLNSHAGERKKNNNSTTSFLTLSHSFDN